LVEIEELGERAVLALAVRIGKARLIDNVMLERRR
jgi:pantothenate synthetase